jgi:RNA polymerase sigma factor (sigma-70 family)
MFVTSAAPHACRFEECLTDEAYLSAWRYACHLAGRREDAEDLLQDSLAHAYRKFSQLRNPDAFRGWLMSIIRSQHIRKWRKDRNRSEQFELKEFMPGPDSPAVEPGGPVAQALAGIPAAQRELLSLFYIEGLSLKETGQVLGLPARAVKQRLFRARAALRRQLEPQYAVGDLSTLF